MNTQGASNGEAPDLLPARMLNEFVYCPRLFYLEYVQGEFEHSSDTVEGQAVHRRVEREAGELPPPEEVHGDRIHAKSVLLSGEKCGIIARIDLVEGENGKVSPVDYKRRAKPDVPEGTWLPDRVQLCAQALILRENGYKCVEGVIYYAGSKERVTISITKDLIEQTLAAVMKARATASSGVVPPPLEDSPKCPRCSLAGICLPDEVVALLAAETMETEMEIRRLYPARDDAIPVYVQEQGAVVTKHGEELEIKKGREIIGKARLMEMSHLALFGNVQVSTQIIRDLCKRNIPTCYFSTGGWFYGITQGMSHKNVELRRRQYAVAGNPERSVTLGRRFIEGKIRNCRTLLRRNSKEVPEPALKELGRWVRAASEAKSAEELLGVEGAASRVYFLHFKDMLRPEGMGNTFDFESRNRRPPKDPVNALLSYVYAILTKDVAVTLLAVGLDPYLGFYHRPRYGRPALALDLMEEFRPIIGDSVVISLINNAEVTEREFVRRGDATSLTTEGKKSVIRAYERRMDTLVTHPIFGYRVSYRRILEVQARLVGRYLSGEIKEYPMFCTR
ncbi:MAG: CRISPR-associated endonuclease Cas1 [Candidatus Thermoplasmatota archaeon]